LAALLIQALIPNIVAVETALTDADGYAAAFLYCPFGHVHAAPAIASDGAGHPGEANTPPADHHSDDGGLADGCSICIALHTSGQFTAPAEFHVGAPSALPQIRPQASRQDNLTALAVAAAYNARAPPLIG
jgi:hypothetical protein